MRCPKCGYISFDHVDTCLKCKKDISGKVEVEGTTYHATAPSFLKVPGRNDQEEDSDFIGNDIGLDDDDDEYELSDPDLDILVDNDEFAFDDEATISFDDADLGEVEEEFQLEVDGSDEDDSFGFDLDDDVDFGSVQEATDLTLPDELTDISDLAPPELEAAPASLVDTNDMSLSLDDEVALDEDLDLDGLDLNLGLGDDSDDSGLALSLDDIDISMNDGIDFEDTDLDGLSIDLNLDDFDEEDSKNKDSNPLGSLDDISLSLD